MLIDGLLAQQMASAASGAAGGPQTMQMVCNAIAQHIVSNMEISGIYNGIGLPPAFPPVAGVQLKGKVVSCNIVGHYVQSTAEFGSMLQQGVVNTVFMFLPPFVGPTGIFGIPFPCPLTVSGTNMQAGTMSHLASQICSWLKSWVPPTPLPGNLIAPPTTSGIATATKTS